MRRLASAHGPDDGDDVSELRHDVVTGRLVLLAPGRAARPHTVAPEPPDPAAVEACPFCPGHEHETPPEVQRTGSGTPDTPGWRIRVFPNLFPIVGGDTPGPGGAGAHEVVALDPDHHRDLARLDDAAVDELFGVLRDRARAHAAGGLIHTQVLVNHGRAAGASIAHPHAQVISVGLVPPQVADGCGRFAAAGTDLLLADAAAAAGAGAGVAEVPALTWCPLAGASASETRVAAVTAGPRFGEATDADLVAVGRATRDVAAGISEVYGAVAYNVVVHSAPHAPAAPDARFHWYVTVVPRLSTVAGFELGTGLLVNTLDPVVAAGRLRTAHPGGTE